MCDNNMLLVGVEGRFTMKIEYNVVQKKSTMYARQLKHDGK